MLQRQGPGAVIERRSSACPTHDHIARIALAGPKTEARSADVISACSHVGRPSAVITSAASRCDHRQNTVGDEAGEAEQPVGQQEGSMAGGHCAASASTREVGGRDDAAQPPAVVDAAIASTPRSHGSAVCRMLSRDGSDELSCLGDVVQEHVFS